MVIVQYSKKLVAPSIAEIMKNYQRNNTTDKANVIGRKFFKYRLA
jgi:hypothetical protein